VTVTSSAHEVDKTSPEAVLPDPTNGTAFADTILNARAASDRALDAVDDAVLAVDCAEVAVLTALEALEFAASAVETAL